MEVFESCDDDNSETELDLRAGPTELLASSFKWLVGDVPSTSMEVSKMSHPQVITSELSFSICGQICIPLA